MLRLEKLRKRLSAILQFGAVGDCILPFVSLKNIAYPFDPIKTEIRVPNYRLLVNFEALNINFC